MRCPSCDEWIILGAMLSGRAIALSLTVWTPATFAAWTLHGGRRPVYSLVNGGVCPVRAGDGVPVSEWRPEHPCGVPQAPERPSTGFTPPCERGEPSMCGRSPQEAAAGVRNCDMCDPVPF